LLWPIADESSGVRLTQNAFSPHAPAIFAASHAKTGRDGLFIAPIPLTMNTTSEFDVEVFDSTMNLVDSVLVSNSDPSGPTPDYDHVIDLTGDTGRYVRVATTTDLFLALSELQVLAVPEPSTIALASLGVFGLVVANRRRVLRW
jgi:PEP-CTERM motif